MSEQSQNLSKNLAYLGLGIIAGAGIYKLSVILSAATQTRSKANKIEDQLSSPDRRVLEKEIQDQVQEITDDFIKNKALSLNLYSADEEFQSELLEHAKIRICQVKHLKDLFPNIKSFLSPLSKEAIKSKKVQKPFIPDEAFVTENTFVVQEKFFSSAEEMQASLKLLRAGARKTVYFEGKTVKAAIVTCGGLCPGLNVVIRSIVMSLTYDYEVQEIWGIKWGYRGFYEEFPNNWIQLTPKIVEGIHNLGGTILGSSRGGFDLDKMIEALNKKGINQLYIIGGDGTHRGIEKLQEGLRAKNLQISIVGIPKTIDNDIPIIDKSFGFQTACEEAVKFIESANVEAEAAENGVGLVKLMGRYCGYIAVASSLASRDVNICLVPEVHYQLEGPDGVYEAILERCKIKGHCIVVMAEGVEDGLMAEEKQKIRNQMGIKDEEKDESGNIKSVDIPGFVKSDLSRYANEKHKMKLTIKYLDPQYAIRSTPANCEDQVLCSKLGYVSVHGIMSGFTDFSVGMVRDEPVMIPIDLLVSCGSRKLQRKDYEWQRIIASTGQRLFLSPQNYKEAIAIELKQSLEMKEKQNELKKKFNAKIGMH